MSSITLQQLIVERIQREGPITFADFMRMALYAPGLGYYVSGPARMGWEGDYYTSSDVSPLFAHCVGRQLYQMWEQLGRPAPFTVLEQGAGRGNLAKQIHDWTHKDEDLLPTTPTIADFAAVLDYHTEDIRMGRDVLEPSSLYDQIDQDSTGASDNDIDNNIESSIRPRVILSNELVDAFPVHIVEKRNARLYEVYVHMQKGRLAEVLGEPSSAEVADYLDMYNIPWLGFNDGWRAEINLDALRWMQHTANLLLSSPSLPRRRGTGFILTIDYGERARMLYTRNRPRGTLASYFQHQLTERYLARPGEQDITAHVNFSALIDVARQHGLRLQTLTTQQRWLEDLGIHEELEQLRTRDFAAADGQRATDQGQIALLRLRTLQQSVAALTDPNGMGNFKVLILKH